MAAIFLKLESGLSTFVVTPNHYGEMSVNLRLIVEMKLIRYC